MLACTTPRSNRFRAGAWPGQQWMPWIHLDDLVALFDHLLQHDDAQGAFNACAPEVLLATSPG